MKDLIFIFKDHLFYFGKKSFLFQVILFLGSNIFVYYYFDIETILNSITTNLFYTIMIYIFLYGYGYYVIAFWYGFVFKNPKVLTAEFLISSFIVLLFLAIEKSAPIHTSLAEILSSYPFVFYTSRILKLFTFPLIVFILYILLAGTMNLKFKSFGITIHNLNVKSFIILLLGILPLVVLASFDKGFQNYYPLYKSTLASEATDIPEYIYVLIYECVYGFNLLSIEVIFRGILVIGFIRLLGKGSIFPMVTVYCFIHLDKPVLECVSSIFGGYILGVIALYSRSIIGGSMLHIGMAWQMEILAWIQKTHH